MDINPLAGRQAEFTPRPTSAELHDECKTLTARLANSQRAVADLSALVNERTLALEAAQRGADDTMAAGLAAVARAYVSPPCQACAEQRKTTAALLAHCEQAQTDLDACRAELARERMRVVPPWWSRLVGWVG